MHVLTDSSCDLPPDLVDRFGLHVIPIWITLDGRSYRDGVDLSRDDFYRRLPGLKTLPTTAAPSLSLIHEISRRYDGENLLGIFVSSKFSSLYGVARQAARARRPAPERRVAVIDSGQLSLGLGWQVLAAAEAAAAGHSWDRTLAAVQSVQRRVRVYALLDTLEYVRHGGRVSALAAGLGDLLHIRVTVELAQGEVKPLFKSRTRRQAMARLVDLTRALGPLERLAVLHARRPADAQHLAEELAPCATQPPLIVEVSGVVVAHVGPAALGIAAVTAS